MALGENPKKPEDFDERVENLIFIRQNVPHRYLEVIDDIREMASGEDIPGVRKEYYKGWQDSDFADLLEAVGEKP